MNKLFSGATAQPLIHKLGQRDTLSGEEKQMLNRAISRVVQFGADEDMAREHDRPSECRLLLEGWTTRYLMLKDGRRQIVGLHIPGDLVDLHSFPLKKMDHSIGTLTPCTVALVPHEALREITEMYPHLTRLLWLSTLVDGAILRQWVLGLGRRSATERMAHLFCELYTRLTLAGLAQDRTFQVPVTQAEFGDCLGLSTVHTNRVLQDLRAEALITWRGETVEIKDWECLQSLAQFDPTYLYLEDEPR
jgi:CRP-like cAMP-binding protein